MNKRQKKKLKNRAGFFHYRDYKLRVKLLYDMFSRVVNHQAPYAFKQLMFDYAKNMLFTKPPKKICDRNLRYKPFLTNCVGTLVGRYADIAKPDVIPSMSMRMVGDKIHSFSIDRPMDNGDVLEIREGTPPLKKPLESKYGAVKVPLEMLNHETKEYLSELAIASRILDEDSFKNGYKPNELAVPLPKGPLDGHKSMTSAKLSAIREIPEMVSAKLTIEHGDTDRMRRQIKYPDTNWPPEGTTVETTISDDGDTRVDVIKRDGEPDLRLVYQGLNEDEPVPVVMSESLAKKLKADGSETLVLVEGECTNRRPLSEETKACLKYRGHVAEDFMGGQAVEYPSSATIDLRKDEDVSGQIHLGPIDLGPTDGERIEEHLDDLIDRRKRFAGNACEAMGMEVD